LVKGPETRANKSKREPDWYAGERTSQDTFLRLSVRACHQVALDHVWLSHVRPAKVKNSRQCEYPESRLLAKETIPRKTKITQAKLSTGISGRNHFCWSAFRPEQNNQKN